jgi:hypothetical protein
MRRIVIAGLCLTAALATAVTGSAAAAAPEFGRCVRVATGTGAYATANCTSPGGENKFEWIPGPGPDGHFTTAIKPETAFLMESAGTLYKTVCFGATGAGEITGPATVANLTLTLTHCENSQTCQTSGHPAGEIVLSGLEGTLGVIKTGETALKDKVGLTLSGEGQFECAGGIVSIVLWGSAIGAISPTNSMAIARKWTLAQRKGLQKPERFEGGLPQAFEWTVNNGAAQRLGLALTSVLTSKEKIEINTVV